MVERLQVKASSIGKILSNLEKKYSSTHGGDDYMKKSPSGHHFGQQQPPNKKAHLKIQEIPPFNANKMRKSPSSSENVENKDVEASTTAPKNNEKPSEE